MSCSPLNYLSTQTNLFQHTYLAYFCKVMMYFMLLQASEFQSAVNSLRDFLPQAEQELKFQPLPEHELAIMQLMERHEKFEDQLQV